MHGLLSPRPLSRSAVLSATERISSVTHLISSLEYLANESDRLPGGLNNWDVIRRKVAVPPAAGKVLDIVADRRFTRALHAARIGAGLILLSPARGRVRLTANLTLSGTSLLLHPRQLYGTDGTDQASFLVQTATTVARAGERRSELVDASLWYVALQGTLSYAASGWAKLPSATWRSGRALPGIMRTRTYGDPSAWRLFQRYPRLARAAASGVLALECAFPAAYLAGGRLARPLVLSAAAFHVANARLMGLGRFTWAFGSTYPALLYTSGPRRHVDTNGRVTDERDDLMPRLTAAVVAGSFAAALAAQARRRQLIMRRRDHEAMMTTSSGNRLAYRRTGPRAESSPVIILEHGLAATVEHWEWFVRKLSERFTTIAYSRAGYGRSRYRAGRPYRLGIAVQDLADLVDQVSGNRPAVLIGHSIGGYLAMQAAARLTGRVVGLGLIDSSHPAELQRSVRQAQGAATLTGTLRLMPASLTLGLGPLLHRPAWVDNLPEPVRDRALAQYRDPRLWRAGRREWRAVLEEFHGFDGRLPDITVPLLVVAAEQTVLSDPVWKELHDEFATSAPRAEYHIIQGAGHDEVLTRQSAADQVIELVAGFVGMLDTTSRGRSHGRSAR